MWRGLGEGSSEVLASMTPAKLAMVLDVGRGAVTEGGMGTTNSAPREGGAFIGMELRRSQ